jgi:hypothetical protein
VAGSCEHGNEYYDSIKGREFNYLSVLLASQGLCSIQLVNEKCFD